MRLRILNEADLRGVLDMPSAIAAMRAAFSGLSDGSAHVPVRTAVHGGPVTTLIMPGFLATPRALGAKVVSVAPANRDRGVPVVQGVVLLVDPDTGAPSALLDGTWLTALRTGAASGLATDLLARAGSRVLGVIGAGAQARTQIAAVCAVRPIEEVRVVSRTRASAEALVDELVRELGGTVTARAVADATAAVRGADIVVTATDSATPVLLDADVAPGTHVNAVGAYRPSMRELPGELVERARVVVDQVAAALDEAGDVLIPLREGRIVQEALVELGDVVLGRRPGRRSPAEITVFKSVGGAAQDLAVAALALERAEAGGIGTLVEPPPAP
jgi:ornithine cyclodeaminase